MSTRDELEVTLSQLYYYYSIIREKEHQRQIAINWVCGVSAIFFVVGLALIRLAYGPSTTATGSIIPAKLSVYFPILGFVIWAGLMGGFASLLVRLGKMPTKGDQDTLLTEFDTVSRTLYSGPLLGAFFAVVLYCAFSARMIEGSIFPKMKTFASQVVTDKSPSDRSETDGKGELKKVAQGVPNKSKTPTTPAPVIKAGATSKAGSGTLGNSMGRVQTSQSGGSTSPDNGSSITTSTADENAVREKLDLSRFLFEMSPTDGLDMALLLVWCFIAGYSQTFVPDKLKAISSGATSK